MDHRNLQDTGHIVVVGNGFSGGFYNVILHQYLYYKFYKKYPNISVNYRMIDADESFLLEVYINSL